MCEVVELAYVKMRERRLNLFAKAEVELFEEWIKSHPDCEAEMYVEKRNKELVGTDFKINIDKR